MEHFYIITNETKDPDFEITYRIRDYLLKCGKKCSIREQVREKRGKIYTDSNMLKEDVDCVLVLGGDGTLLQAAADLADLSVPFLGINLGTLGFLAEVNKDDMEEAFSKLLAGEYEIENRMMLYGCCYRPGEDGEMDNARALNDIVITRKGSLQIYRVQSLGRRSGGGSQGAAYGGYTDLSALHAAQKHCALTRGRDNYFDRDGA